MGLTAAEAAVILGTTPGHVDRIVHRGLLPSSGTSAAVWPSRSSSGCHWNGSTDAGLSVSGAARAEAAELLGVTPKRVTQLAERERIPAVRHAGHRYFRRSQLEVGANARAARDRAQE